jgi:hypothetical protein
MAVRDERGALGNRKMLTVLNVLHDHVVPFPQRPPRCAAVVEE